TILVEDVVVAADEDGRERIEVEAAAVVLDDAIGNAVPGTRIGRIVLVRHVRAGTVTVTGVDLVVLDVGAADGQRATPIGELATCHHRELVARAVAVLGDAGGPRELHALEVLAR